MSESFPDKVNRLEHEPRIEAGHSAEQEKLLRAQNERAKAEKDPAMSLQEAAGQVNAAEQSAPPDQTAEKLHAANAAPAPASTGFIDRNLRKITAQRGLKQVQRHESAPERSFSRVIHQPVVRVVSEATGKTLSRPSGILGGGLMALIGTSGYLYLAKNQGFEYNYLVFLALFAAGFVFGLLLEFIVFVALRSKHRPR